MKQLNHNRGPGRQTGPFTDGGEPCAERAGYRCPE